MKHKSQQPLEPKLRFPEYRDEPGWDEASVEELISTVAPPKKLLTSDYLEEGRYPVIDQSQAYQCGWTNDDAALIADPLPLIVFGDHTCVLKFVDHPFAQGADGIKIFSAVRDVSTEYLYHCLNHRPLVMEDYRRHFSILKGRSVFYSNIDCGEQQEIAGCLTSLDELIAAHSRKLEALRVHKKSLMQQLFPREGEPQPCLRFPEFRVLPNWEERAIGELGEVVTGSTPSTRKRDYYGGQYLFVSPADITDLRFVEETQTTLTKSGFQQARSIKATSVLFVCIGSTIGKVAQNSEICATNQQINSIIPSSENSGGFLYYLLSANSDSIANLAGKQAVPIINKTLFSSVKLVVPELPEQQRIADCLSFLDDQIAAQVRKIEALKAHKKGLMQQLFPSPEEEEEV